MPGQSRMTPSFRHAGETLHPALGVALPLKLHLMDLHRNLVLW
jgi:hypothetical protein